MKKIFLFILVLLFFCPFNINALVNKSSNIYVTDSSDVLSYETEKYIVDLSTRLKENSKIDFYVVTINDTDDMGLEEYADLLYDEFKISSNGILIILSVKDRIIRVKIGEKLSSDIDRATIDGYIRMYFMPFFKVNDWNRGILNGYSAFYKLICDKNNIDSSNIVVYDDVDFITKYKEIILVIIIWLNTVFAYVFCNYFINVYKRKFKFELFDFILFIITLVINILLLIFVYNIDLISYLFVFLLEICCIYYNITSCHLNNIKNKNNKKNRDICYNRKQGGKHEKKRSR